MKSIRHLLRALLCLVLVVALPAFAGNTSTTTLTAAPNPSTAGQLVTVTATVTGNGGSTPTGAVTFFDGMTSLGGPVTLNANGVATFSTTGFAIGSHSLTATYGGNQIYPASTSPAVTLVVGQAAPTSIPALGAFGFALLALGLAGFAWRRRHA